MQLTRSLIIRYGSGRVQRCEAIYKLVVCLYLRWFSNHIAAGCVGRMHLLATQILVVEAS